MSLRLERVQPPEKEENIEVDADWIHRECNQPAPGGRYRVHIFPDAESWTGWSWTFEMISKRPYGGGYVLTRDPQ